MFEIVIINKANESVTIAMAGVEAAWETFERTSETLEGLAEVRLIDGETGEVLSWSVVE